MLIGQLIATFFAIYSVSLNMVLCVRGQEIPPLHFICMSAALTFLLWSFGIFG